MKIDHNVTFLKPASGNPIPVRSSPSAPTSAPPPAESQAMRPLSATPLVPSTHGDFDAARVAEIRESISAGRYQVDTARIADSLLASVRDLLNAKAP